MDLVNELAPVGALEEDIVATLARLAWRKQNLAIFGTAELARDQYGAIYDEHCGKRDPIYLLGSTPMAREAAEAAEAQAREELRDTNLRLRLEEPEAGPSGCVQLSKAPAIR